MAQLLGGHARDTSAQARPRGARAGGRSGARVTFSRDLPSLGSRLRFTLMQPRRWLSFPYEDIIFAKQNKKTLSEKEMLLSKR